MERRHLEETRGAEMGTLVVGTVVLAAEGGSVSVALEAPVVAGSADGVE